MRFKKLISVITAAVVTSSALYLPVTGAKAEISPPVIKTAESNYLLYDNPYTYAESNVMETEPAYYETVEPSESESTVTASGTCGENLTWTLTSDSVLIVSGTGEMDNYYSSKAPWYDYISSIKACVIENGVTSIGSSAFAECRSLTSITIPDSVTSIGDWAFNSCSSLTSITIPDSVTSIGDWAFNFCNSLTSITIPDSVTSIIDNAFGSCEKLTEIHVDSKNPDYCDIDGVLFNKSLSKIICYPAGKTDNSYIIPSNVTSIGEQAFNDCSSLTSITIPDSVTSIGLWAFWDCTGLTSITIPKSVTSIATDAFDGCDSLTIRGYTGSYAETYANENNISFESIGETEPDLVDSGTCGENLTWTLDKDGLLIISGTGEMDDYSQSSEAPLYDYPWYDYNSSIKACVIESDVTSIGSSAFAECRSLTSITIPDSVTSIGAGAFLGCTGLTSITIPVGVTSINGSVFEGCTGLTSITMPDSVIYILAYAFESCTSLTSITIPDSVTSISSWTFNNCTSLANVTIPDSVTFIEHCAFGGCTGLTSITIPKSVTSIGTDAFDGCDSLTIRGYTGSYAETYAKENEIPFEALDETELKELPDAIKFVLYSADISEGESEATYKCEGQLPKGMSLNETTGKISGIPLKEGKYTFKITVSVKGAEDKEINCSLKVADNQNGQHVTSSSDVGYEITTPIGEESVSGSFDYFLTKEDIKKDQEFVSNGNFSEFYALWLNGRMLERDVEYTAREGSTVITIKGETLQELPVGDVNTIVAEFHTGENGEDIKKAAQNFVIKGTEINVDTTPVRLPRPEEQGSVVSVESASGAKGGSGIMDEINKTPAGGTVEITLTGGGGLPASVLKAAAERKILLKVNIASNSWFINGATITKANSVNLTVNGASGNIPANILSTLSGTAVIPISIDADEFFFTAQLTYNLGTKYAGQYSNIYRYNGSSLELVSAASVTASGNATHTLTKGGDYVLVVDTETQLSGDMNNSCRLDSFDVSNILSFILGKTKFDRPEKADVNGDGRVDALDAAWILKNIIGAF